MFRITKSVFLDFHLFSLNLVEMNRCKRVQRENLVTKKSITTKVNGAASQTKKAVTVISHNKRSLDANIVADGRTHQAIRRSAGHEKPGEKYAAPELNTMLTMCKRLEDLKTPGSNKIKDFNDMTPRTKNVATEEVQISTNEKRLGIKFIMCLLLSFIQALKRLNFVSHRPVYKHLVPINVNDSVLEVKSRAAGARRSSSRREQTSNKDPEPNLCDYLTPSEPLKLTHQVTWADIDSGDEYDEKTIRTQNFNDNYIRLYQFYDKYLRK